MLLLGCASFSFHLVYIYKKENGMKQKFYHCSPKLFNKNDILVPPKVDEEINLEKMLDSTKK
jgi:hypothetical protein